jgi:hypothetical protein
MTAGQRLKALRKAVRALRVAFRMEHINAAGNSDNYILGALMMLGPHLEAVEALLWPTK